MTSSPALDLSTNLSPHPEKLNPMPRLGDFSKVSNVDDVAVWKENSSKEEGEGLGVIMETPESEKANLVLEAVCEGNSEHLSILLGEGSDPNEPVCGVYPIIIAIENNHMDCLKILLKSGARTKVKSSSGVSAIGKSVRFCTRIYEPSSLDLLLEHSADPNWLDDFNMAPLHHALNCHNHRAINKLLDAGADVDLIGRSILHWLAPHMDACFHFSPPNYNLPDTFLRLVGGLKYSTGTHRHQMKVIIERFMEIASIIWITIKDSEDVHRWESYLDIVRFACSVGYSPPLEELRAIARLFPPKAYKRRLLLFAEKPRSLKDLCRIHLRRGMLGRIEDEAERLPLPKDLRDFVLIRNRVHFTRI